MDLNIENYNIDELLNLFKINEKDCDINILQKNLSKSIALINNEVDDLPEDKDKLIDFYTHAAFKILNSKKIIENNIKYNKQDETSVDTYKNNDSYINSNLLDENQKITNRKLINGGIRQPIPPIYTINTNNTNYSEGTVNPIERESVKSILTINSKFRDNYSKSSTDFIVELNEPINNVTSIKLASMEILNSYYAISEYLKTNIFSIQFFQYNTITNDISINSIFTHKFTIPDGNYNVYSITDTINEVCFLNNESDPSGIPFYRLVKTEYDEIKGKIGFQLNDFSGNLPDVNNSWGFNLDFRDINLPNRAPFLNLGWLLGYRELIYYFFQQPMPNPTPCDNDFFDYKYKSPCTDGYKPFYQFTKTNILNIGFNPEAIANLIGTHYYMLEVDDFNKNQSEVLKSNIEVKHNIKETFNYSVFNILARIPNTGDFYSIIFEDSSDRVFKSRKYFGPVRISRLKIRLLDENGIVINLNNNDIIINLEIETINSSYKNLVYRN